MKQYLRLDNSNKVVGMFSLPEGEGFDCGNDIVVENPTPFPSGWPSGSRPSQVLHWINGAVAWVETASLVKLKADKNTYINSSRLVANRSTFTFSDRQVACDELSRSDIDAVNGVVSLLGSVPITEWKAVDNTYIPVPDKVTWVNFYLAMVQQGQQNFAKAQALKAQLADATTVEQVAAIVWTT